MTLSSEEKLHRLQRALEYGGGTHTLSDLIETLHAGKAKLWESGNGCIITEIQQYPQFRAINYWLIFGTLPECLALDDDINAWALDQGCKIATASGRRGWARVGAPHGWQLHGYQFWKPLVS